MWARFVRVLKKIVACNFNAADFTRSEEYNIWYKC